MLGGEHLIGVRPVRPGVKGEHISHGDAVVFIEIGRGVDGGIGAVARSADDHVMQEDVVLQRCFLKCAVGVLNVTFNVVKAVCVHIEDYRVRGCAGVNVVLIVGVCKRAVVSARIEDHAARIGIALLGHIYEPKPVPVKYTVADVSTGVG